MNGLGGNDQDDPTNREQSRPVFSPFGRTNVAEQKQKSMQLLARYALGWELQKAGRETSVTAMDHKWREKQRTKAQIDLGDTALQPETNWMTSLRGGENIRAAERRIGKTDPIVFTLPVERVNAALKTVAEQPEYVPVNERLPSRLRRRNQAYLERVAQERSAVQRSIEEQQQFELQVVEEDISVELEEQQMQQRIPDETGAPATEKQRDQLAFEIFNGPHAVGSFQQAEAHFSASRELFPYLQIDSLAAVCSPDEPSAVIQVQNLGDTVLSLQLISLECARRISDALPSPPAPAAPAAPAAQSFPVASRAAVSSPSQQAKARVVSPSKQPLLRTPQANDFLQRNNLPTLNKQTHLVQSKRHTTPGIQTTRYADKTQISSALETRASAIETASQNDGLGPGAATATAAAEKTATPWDLRQAAITYVHRERGQAESSLTVVHKPGTWLCSVGKSQAIRFLLPTGGRGEPGVILQEFCLSIQPAAAVHLKGGFALEARQSVQQLPDRTLVFLRAYGLQNQITKLQKERRQWGKTGQALLSGAVTQRLCRNVVESLVDGAVQYSYERNKQRELEKREEQNYAAYIVKETVAAFETGCVRGKFLKDPKKRQEFIYETVSETSASIVLEENVLAEQLVARLLDDVLLRIRRQTKASGLGFGGGLPELAALVACYSPARGGKNGQDCNQLDAQAQEEEAQLEVLRELRALVEKKPDEGAGKPQKNSVCVRDALRELGERLRGAEERGARETYPASQLRELCEPVLRCAHVSPEAWDRALPGLAAFVRAEAVQDARQRRLREAADAGAFLRFFRSRDPGDLTSSARPADARSEPHAGPGEEFRRAFGLQLFGSQKKQPALRPPEENEAGLRFADCVLSAPAPYRQNLPGIAEQPAERPAPRQVLLDCVSVLYQLQALPQKALSGVALRQLRPGEAAEYFARLKAQRDAVLHPPAPEVTAPPPGDKKPPRRSQSLTPGPGVGGEPGPAAPEPVYLPYDALYERDAEETKRQLKLACMARELEAFIDAVTDPRVEEAVRLHADLSAAYAEERAIFEDNPDGMEEPRPPCVAEELGLAAETPAPPYPFRYTLAVTQTEALRAGLLEALLCVSSGPVAAGVPEREFRAALKHLTKAAQAAKPEDLPRLIETLFGIRLEFSTPAASVAAERDLHWKLPAPHRILNAQLEAAAHFSAPETFSDLSQEMALLAPGALLDLSRELSTRGGKIRLLSEETLKETPFQQKLFAVAQEFIKAEAKTAPKTEAGTHGTDDQEARSAREKTALEEEQPEEEEAEENSNVTPIRREVDDATKARREVWAWLFDRALDRAADWLEAVDRCAETLLVRAGNYIARGPLAILGLE